MSGQTDNSGKRRNINILFLGGAMSLSLKSRLLSSAVSLSDANGMRLTSLNIFIR